MADRMVDPRTHGQQQRQQQHLPQQKSAPNERMDGHHGDYFMGQACHSMTGTLPHPESWEASDARPLLPKASFFMGDLRDGLPMLNMQAVFLMSAKDFSEKQIGTLFLAFGLSQFVFMTPAGYFLDYSNSKINWVVYSGAITSLLTVVTALVVLPGGENMGLMILLKVLQGGISAIIPPGFNSITLGIVGATGFTHQVSRNRMMNHIGTALIVAIGSLVAYLLYPNIGVLFMVSPLAMIGVYYNLVRIKPNHVDPDASRALIIESPTMTEYEHFETESSMAGLEENLDEDTDSSESFSDEDVYKPPDNAGNRIHALRAANHQQRNPAQSTVIRNDNFGAAPMKPPSRGSGISSHESRPRSIWRYNTGPSFNLGWGAPLDDGKVEPATNTQETLPRARTPLAVLLDPTLVIFTLVMFTFHLANASVLPLVMQSLSLEDEQSGILLSGLCILIGQGFMSWFAKICGDYSPTWGRKGLTLVALSSLTFRCFFLTVLMRQDEYVRTDTGATIVKSLILSTQVLDSVGAGIFGTMHILVTNDISCKTGRFSLMMGVTTGGMCLGATVSGFLGQSIAEDYGYAVAFASLGMLSLFPLSLYAFCMPETLPDYAKPESRKKRLMAVLKKLNEQRRKMNPFRRRRRKTQNKTATVQLIDDATIREGLMMPSTDAEFV